MEVTQCLGMFYNFELFFMCCTVVVVNQEISCLEMALLYQYNIMKLSVSVENHESS